MIPSPLKLDPQELDELRKRFESMLTDSYGFRRSRRGVYVNPVIQNRWSWYLRGFADGVMVSQ